MEANVYKQRLLNVARALRESPEPNRFTMREYAHDCRTPACAFGHYGHRTDLQDVFVIETHPASGIARVITADGGMRVDWDQEIVFEHFGLDFHEAEELFGDSIPRDEGGFRVGCGNAQTAIEAAEYIEAFVARKWGNQ